MKFDKFINNLLGEDSLSGGLADKATPESIAKKHNVPVEDILFQIAKGIKVEYEHTKEKSVAQEIAMDHLFEIPDYYDRLADMEKEADGETPKEEMVSGGTGGVLSGGVVDAGGTGGSVGNVDSYAPGDSRIPSILFKSKKKKKNKKDNKKETTTINIQRRPKTGM